MVPEVEGETLSDAVLVALVPAVGSWAEQTIFFALRQIVAFVAGAVEGQGKDIAVAGHEKH